MTVNPNATSEAAPAPSDKELNFRKQEEMFTRKLEQEKQARLQAEQRLNQLEAAIKQRPADLEDEDPTDDPYVDHRRLKREIGKVKQTVSETESRIQQAVQAALAEERKSQWMKQNPDFYEVMNHAQTLADQDPELAETILSMPDGFERQKLVYKTIKSTGLHKPKEEKKSSMQDQINSNRKPMYYSPSGLNSPPFENTADFSSAGQQNAYKKMQELKKRLGVFS